MDQARRPGSLRLRQAEVTDSVGNNYYYNIHVAIYDDVDQKMAGLNRVLRNSAIKGSR